MAEVVSYNSHNHRYIVDDIDEEGHNERRLGMDTGRKGEVGQREKEIRREKKAG